MSKGKRAPIKIEQDEPEPVPEALRDLDAKAAPKPIHPVEAALAARQPSRATPEAGKGTTVHLTKDAARELKKLAADRDTTVHALMVEGVNLVFRQYGIQHTAAAGPRPDAVRKLASKKAG